MFQDFQTYLKIRHESSGREGGAGCRRARAAAGEGVGGRGRGKGGTQGGFTGTGCYLCQPFAVMVGALWISKPLIFWEINVSHQ